MQFLMFELTKKHMIKIAYFGSDNYNNLTTMS